MSDYTVGIGSLDTNQYLTLISSTAVIVIGKLVYTLGSILVASAATIRSYDFMVAGRIVMAMGDITTQVAQYKMFSSWFAPSNGFAATLGFEGASGKVRFSDL